MILYKSVKIHINSMENVKNILSKFKDKHILVVGDIMLDWYTYGQVTRVSPEAPVPVIHKTDEKFVLGGAGNVAVGIAALGAKATLAGTVGDDEFNQHVFDLIRRHKLGACLLMHREKPTIVKHRMIAGTTQQLLRLDREDTKFIEDSIAEQLFEKIDPIILSCDMVILSGYAKGTLSPLLLERIIERAHECGKQLIADLKPKTKEFYRGVDVICPNIKEAREMTGLTDGGMEDVGKRLVEDMGAELVMTCGGDGISVFDKAGNYTHIPGHKVGVADVTGAGDWRISLKLAGALP